VLAQSHPSAERSEHRLCLARRRLEVCAMLRSTSKSLWLLTFVVVLVCGIYPASLGAIGQTLSTQVNDSIVNGPDRKPVGSLLVAQPFTKDGYFRPSPSVTSYDAAASASGAGLDPDISLENAEFQLDRIAGKWAQDLERGPAQVRQEIESMLKAHAFSPDDGLFDEVIVNVLELNLDLRTRYGAPS
jgi:K+-transporting ATPase c subunit